MLRRLMTALSMAACLALTAFAVRAQDMPRASARVEGLLARMTVEEKIGQLVQMPGGRQRAPNSRINDAERARIRAGRVGSYLNVAGAEATRALQRIAVEEIAAAHSPAVRDGRDPRLPDDLPGAAGDGVELGPGGARARRAHRRHRGRGGGPALDLLADGRHRPRSALGPDRRGRRRGPLSRRGDGRRPGARLSGRRASTGPTRSWPPPSISPPMAPRWAGAIMRGADISERSLEEIYLPPFYAAAREGAGSFMAAFNDDRRRPGPRQSRAAPRHAARRAGAGRACWSATGTRSPSCATTASPGATPTPPSSRCAPASTWTCRASST